MPSAELLDTSRTAPVLRAVRSAGWLALALLSATPVFFYFSASISWLVTVCVAALALLALWSTSNAVLVLAALAPIATSAQLLAGAPRDGYAFLEVWVLV